MSISVQELSDIIITESPSGPFIDPNNATIANRFERNVTLDSSTVPAVTKYSCFSQPLAGGLATIDLTSLPDNNGVAGAVTFDGLRVARAIFHNPDTNANAITVTFGGSDPHLLNGTAFKYILLPGEEIEYKGFQTGVVVDDTHKNWSLSGTGVQALDVFLIAGA